MTEPIKFTNAKITIGDQTFDAKVVEIAFGSGETVSPVLPPIETSCTLDFEPSPIAPDIIHALTTPAWLANRGFTTVWFKSLATGQRIAMLQSPVGSLCQWTGVSLVPLSVDEMADLLLNYKAE